MPPAGEGTGRQTTPAERKSGREDLNLRPQRPERCALTGLRYAPQPTIIVHQVNASNKPPSGPLLSHAPQASHKKIGQVSALAPLMPGADAPGYPTKSPFTLSLSKGERSRALLRPRRGATAPSLRLFFSPSPSHSTQVGLSHPPTPWRLSPCERTSHAPTRRRRVAFPPSPRRHRPPLCWVGWSICSNHAFP